MPRPARRAAPRAGVSAPRRSSTATSRWAKAAGLTDAVSDGNDLPVFPFGIAARTASDASAGAGSPRLIDIVASHLAVIWSADACTHDDGSAGQLAVAGSSKYASRYAGSPTRACHVAGAPFPTRCCADADVPDHPVTTARQFRHHFGPSLRDIWALYHPTHAVHCALLACHAFWMLIVACDPML